MQSPSANVDDLQTIVKDPLWLRIRNYSFDAEDATLAFTARLIRENGWSKEMSLRAIEEYRRFVYLACRAGHSVTPSDEVDQVWHLHLQYTREYWDHFCPEVLGQALHHDPTEGGKKENEKYNDWYARTMASYRRIFLCEPPSDLWPPARRRFGDVPYFRRLNTKGLWVVTRVRAVSLALGTVLCTAVVAAAATNKGSKENDYIFLFLILFVVFILVIKYLEDKKYSKDRSKDKKSDSAGGCGGGGCGGCGGGCGG